MSQAYLVTLRELSENMQAVVVLKEYNEVVDLLQNLDRDTYDLSDIATIEVPVFYESKPFLKTDEKLELGANPHA